MELSTSEPTTARFDALYRATASDVFAYVMTLVRDRASAEDVTALTFERAYRRQASFDPGKGSQRAWLFGIARNAALDELRARKRTTALLADPEDPAAASDATADHDDDAAVRRATVRAALAQLSPRERELIALKFHAGLSNVEIAKVLGISAANAGTRVHRAVTRLRKACHAPS
ncbi:MAG TPA: sigma-70 family RNA polymerase sigma factor [Baekduia sp.]|uniref:RNA polymerase sigma factor n=1 Tax=Baekduia sp. TaxID=2600305 RepID=UPI002D77FD8C|nr:sigma-70 family RNA polymerase sigma factor [Baekduia sp.]HET6505488.1 sigma-70 family RNA polymerase sigma factor [Baekduia sp.]